DRQKSRLETVDIEENGQELGEAVGVLDDHRRGRPGRLGIRLAGGQAAKKELGVTSNQRDGRLHVMPCHGEDVFTELFEIASSGDVVKHHDATLEAALWRAER